MYDEVNTYEDLEELGIGQVFCDISHRGGGIGFYGSDVARHFDINEHEVPGKVGAYCNYLGGGLRGSICASPADRVKDDEKRAKIESLAEACKRVYQNIEDESGMNDDEYPDGDTNWDAQGTKACRNAGVESAY